MPFKQASAAVLKSDFEESAFVQVSQHHLHLKWFCGNPAEVEVFMVLGSIEKG